MVIHTTFQRFAGPGKKARLREFGLWHMDPPEYYGAPSSSSSTSGTSTCLGQQIGHQQLRVPNPGQHSRQGSLQQQLDDICAAVCRRRQQQAQHVAERGHIRAQRGGQAGQGGQRLAPHLGLAIRQQRPQQLQHHRGGMRRRQVGGQGPCCIRHQQPPLSELMLGLQGQPFM